MPLYSELLASLERGAGGRITAVIPEDWMQGRTTYGGLTAALSLEGATPLAEGAPIRSAQVAFVGPVGGPVSIEPTLLRRGRNTAFVSVDMIAEGAIVARSVFAFGVKRESALDFNQLEAPSAGAPDETPSFFGERRPRFAEHFNIRLVAGARPVSGATEGDLTLWMRHKDEAAPMNATTLLSIADAPPPAAFSMLKTPGAISSMSWMAEFLTDEIETREGWFLARHAAQTARDGYSSQSMRMWNAEGEPVMIGRQTIAVFG